MPDSAKTPYGWSSLTGDLSGGFIASLIAFPYGLAMASLMGLPPILGVFTSILTAPITAVLGRNPVLIGGVSSVTVPFILAAVHAQGLAGAAKVSIIAALVMLLFGALKLGRYVALVPHPVMAGFSCGIGGMMVISQLRTITGLKGSSLNPTTILTAAIVILFATVSARISHKLPAPLIGILAAVLIAALFGWTSKEIGMLPTGLPPLANFAWKPEDLRTILPAGFGLAFVSSVNLLVTSRVVDHFRGRHKVTTPSDSDRELGAYAVANLAAGMFAAPMSVGIPARSLANVQCGATTRLSNLFHAAFLLMFVLEASRLIAHIPVAALAAITAWMGVRLMEWSTWRRLHKMRRTDAAAFLTTALSAVFLNAVFAVAFGCAFYVVRGYFKRRAAALNPRWRSGKSLLRAAASESSPPVPR